MEGCIVHSLIVPSFCHREDVTKRADGDDDILQDQVVVIMRCIGVT